MASLFQDAKDRLPQVGGGKIWRKWLWVKKIVLPKPVVCRASLKKTHGQIIAGWENGRAKVVTRSGTNKWSFVNNLMQKMKQMARDLWGKKQKLTPANDWRAVIFLGNFFDRKPKDYKLEALRQQTMRLAKASALMVVTSVPLLSLDFCGWGLSELSRWLWSQGVWAWSEDDWNSGSLGILDFVASMSKQKVLSYKPHYAL